MKKGVRKEALLNFNSLTEEMIFESNGVRLAVAQMELTDIIYIKGRKFFRSMVNFWWRYITRNMIYMPNKCSVNDPGKPAGHGTFSQLGAATTYSFYFSGNRVYEMTLPASVETTPFTLYWLEKDG